MNISQALTIYVLRPIGRWIAARSKTQVFLACLALTCVIGAVDFIAGREVSLSIVYAVPISLAAWFLGRTRAMLLAVLSIVMWISGDIGTGVYRIGLIVPILNATFRITFYWLLIVVLLRLARLQKGLEKRAELRAAALARETAERERLEHEMLELSEREHRRFGQDIHDGLCQHLTGTALAGHALAERLAASGVSESAGIQRIVDLVEEAIVLARGMAKGLHPVALQPDGLMLALEEFAASTSQMFGVKCLFECHGPVLIHDPAYATHLYRITQEGVANAIKHGPASEIVISLEESENGVFLAVSDNGKGFDASQQSNNGMGLRIMADRAKMIGGQLTITKKAKGAELIFRVPRKMTFGEVDA